LAAPPYIQLALGCAVMRREPLAYLGEALLAVVLEVLGVDVDVVLVHAVGLRELGGVLDKLLHLHGGRVAGEVLEGLHRHVGRSHAVWTGTRTASEHSGCHLETRRRRLFVIIILHSERTFMRTINIWRERERESERERDRERERNPEREREREREREKETQKEREREREREKEKETQKEREREIEREREKETQKERKRLSEKETQKERKRLSERERKEERKRNRERERERD